MMMMMMMVIDTTDVMKISRNFIFMSFNLLRYKVLQLNSLIVRHVFNHLFN